MSGRAHEREHGFAARNRGLDRGYRAAGCASRRGQRVLIDDDVAGRKVLWNLGCRDLAFDELAIGARVNPLDLLVGSVARGSRFREQAAGAQPRPDDFNPIGALGMIDAPQVLAVQGVGNELQRVAFA
jgi:hypothetical protein